MSRRLLRAIRGSAAYAPIRRWRLERLTRRPGVYPQWAALLAEHEASWREALSNADGPRVAIATSLGLHFTANTMDSLLSVALTQRGARVEVLFCDGVLPACQIVDHTLAPSVRRIAERGPQPDFCGACFGAADRLYAPLHLPVKRLSAYLSTGNHREAEEFADGWVDRAESADMHILARHAYAGALRFFGAASLPADATGRKIYRRYLRSAFLAHRASTKLMQQRQYDVVIAHHGIYTPQGPMVEAARDAGARIVTWHAAYRRGRVIFQHDDTYHTRMAHEPDAHWNQALTAEQKVALDEYLTSRETGAQDWISFQRAGPENPASLFARLGLDPEKPTFLLAANVAWDARLHYPQSAYGHMIDWALDTVRWFANHPDRQLVVRCHPGEVLSSPRATDRLDEAISDVFPELPENIRVIPPQDTTNTYTLAALSRAVLVFNTKMAMEAAARGQSVIVAGDSWVRGKGFSHDASSPQDYRNLLARSENLEPLSVEALARAQRYAYHFFFRRCVPVRAFDTEKGWPLTALRADAYRSALPGADPGLDAICQGVLSGKPFFEKGSVENVQATI